ncbi:hypothetical protein D3C74_474260 [compost metagenome]
MDEQRIREIVREEIAAQRSDEITITVNSQEIGRAAVKAINEAHKKLDLVSLKI